MDDVLHAQRLDGRGKRVHHRPLSDLPDGAMIAQDCEVYAVKAGMMLHWSPSGYTQQSTRPNDEAARVLTPPAILNVLTCGYRPRWHPSAMHIAGADKPDQV
jgi:hypothetical protein